MRQIGPGAIVTRLIAGIVSESLTVTAVTEDTIVCGAYTFDRATGAELDNALGWGAPPLTTGSFLVLDQRSDVTPRRSSGTYDSSNEEGQDLAITKLVRLVHQVVAESGSLDGFDAALLTANFLRARNPALGGRTPAEFMDTVEGREQVFNLILRMQHGTYS